MYKGGAFVFSFAINTNYPHDPPKVKCTQKVSGTRYPACSICLKRIRFTTLMSIWRGMFALIFSEKTGNPSSILTRSWLDCNICS